MITTEQDLYHYGVLGMKWGVRHDKQRAYELARKKVMKTDAKIQKKKQKSAARYVKGQKAATGLFVNQRKATKNFNKAAKLQKRITKMESKGMRFINQMDKIFSKADYKVDEDIIRLGERYLDSLNASASMLYNARLYSTYKR